eukprot:TRINITY_DN5226_c3_g1_i1.p1 TRINITY_DN5226_c3_g1~~TRINITY_DN5226_c3_g1_i1.p1  ORF type:complete len:215 (-),score=55.36 TRINITY_DN5226_c3_g1_i1:202-768(-)
MAHPNAGRTVGDLLGEQLLEAAKDREDALDEELKRLDNMKEDDFEELRRKRLEKMKEGQKKRQEMIAIGHGEYQLIEEKDFFDVAKKSEFVVVAFGRPSTWRSEIVDKHLKPLSQKHWGTRFVKLDAEKAPYLTERLRIWMLPSIVLCIKGHTEHTIVGFDELGDVDDFETEELEVLLAKWGVIKLDS